MADMNYFEIRRSRVGDIPAGAHVQHGALMCDSNIDKDFLGQAIDVAVGYFFAPGTLADRLSQTDTASRRLVSQIRTYDSGVRQLHELHSCRGSVETIRSQFNQYGEGLDIVINANMSNGKAPINLVTYALCQQGNQYHQAVFFDSMSGSEKAPLHLKQMVGILERAKEADFEVEDDALAELKQGVIARHSPAGDEARAAIRARMAYLATDIREELITFIFDE